MDGQVMDLSPTSSVSTSLSEEMSDFSDDSGCGKDYLELKVPPCLPHIGSGPLADAQTLEWYVKEILRGEDMQQRELIQQLHKEKIEACHQLELPLDPWKWTSTDVRKWASWFMHRINAQAAQEVSATFENYPITGETLANYSENNLQQYFGAYTQKAHECLQIWLDGMSPRCFEIQQQLLQIENTRQNCLNSLITEMSNPLSPGVDIRNPSITLTPPHSEYEARHAFPTPDDAGLQHTLNTNTNVIVQHIKPELPAFGFSESETCMMLSADYQHPYPPSPLEQCTDPPMHNAPGEMGGSSGIFGPDEFESITEKDFMLPPLDPDCEDPGKMCIVKEEPAFTPQPVKRKRGRPRKPKCPKKKREQPILYKFILHHLNNTSGDSGDYLAWVNKSEGLFRFFSPKKDDFAEMWSRFKGKREYMTYQNMARALRNYTRGNRKIMTSVRKKLHYKFTPMFIR